MDIFTIGSSGKSYDTFTTLINYYKIQMLLDIRLKNNSSLLGFTRERDLPSILRDKCSCKYEHCANYAPTKELLTSWRKKLITWEEYEEQYRALMIERNAVKDFIVRFNELYDVVCLLCSEPTPEHCHRRLLAEMIADALPGTEVIHIP